mgnify:CR=1 FL=1
MGSLLLLGGISIVIMIARALVFRSRFSQSKYDETNGANWFQVMRDTGAVGEFYTYEKLENLPGHHHLITNLYLPKKRGGTTEVDLVFICESGIYVIESKNYSGWIFGNEKGRYWTQVLNKNHKERFFNPIMQNTGHITALKDVLELDDSYFRSVIVFSERCQLKKIEMESDDILVIKRDQLARLMKEECLHGDKCLSKSEVDAIFYRKLLPYSHADQEKKDEHIRGIKGN